MNNDILDFYMTQPATFGNVYTKHPPCNDFGIGEAIAAAALVASAAGTAVSYENSQNQAKQEQLNAQAQANALNQEAQRQQQAFQENQRRMAMQQQQERKNQLAQIVGNGLEAGTGTALSLEADSWAKDQRDLNDNAYLNQLSQNQLQYQASNALSLGEQQAGQYKAAGNASLLSGIAGTLSSASSLKFGGSGSGSSSSKSSSTSSPVTPSSGGPIPGNSGK